MRAVNSFDR